jgi:hypothetical protein
MTFELQPIYTNSSNMCIMNLNGIMDSRVLSCVISNVSVVLFNYRYFLKVLGVRCVRFKTVFLSININVFKQSSKFEMIVTL